MAGIFISYRERDSKGWALSLRDRLVEAFGEDKVFLDKDALRAGKWKDQIERALGDCNVVLVVVGRGWLNATDDQNRQRLMLDDDVHRREIALALARTDVTVIPVLVDGATMPKADELPEDIRDLRQQQTRAISDSAAHRRVDLDGLIGDIHRVGGLHPKPDPNPTPTPQPPPGPLKNSGKAIVALSLVGLVILAAASEGGLDHEAKLGSLFILGLGLWFAIRGYGDVKSGMRKGRGLSLAAIGVTALTGLGLLGTLGQADSPKTAMVNNIVPPAPIPVPRPELPPPLANITPAKIDAPKQVAKHTSPAPKVEPEMLTQPEREPVEAVAAADYRGIWQDGHDFTIFYVLRQEGNAVYLQQYNAYGALTFEATGVPNGSELKIDHPRLSASLALSEGGQQLSGSSKDKANGLMRPILLRKVDLNSLDPQLAQLLRPLVQ